MNPNPLRTCTVLFAAPSKTTPAAIEAGAFPLLLRDVRQRKVVIGLEDLGMLLNAALEGPDCLYIVPDRQIYSYSQ
jgi:hypothetical protein